MRGCGTMFKDRRLSAVERETLIDLERLAKRLHWQSEQLYNAVESCRRNETTEGLDEMVAYSFNANMHTPQYGGGGGEQLPAGPNGEDVWYKVVIINSEPVDTTDNFGNIKGGYMAFTLACIEGPEKDRKQTDRLNLHNSNPQVVDIANKQLSAYSHVLGKFQWQDTQELHNTPFMVKIGLQRDKQGKPHEKGFTEVKAVADINGNEPGKAGSGPQVNQGNQGGAPNNAPNNAPAGGVTATGGGWGGGNDAGQNNNNNNNNNGQNGGPAVDSNVSMNNGNNGGGQGGGGWGGPNNGGNNNGGGQNNGGNNGGGWGGNNQGQGGQGGQGGNGGGNAGWGGQGGQSGGNGGGGGSPGWGNGQ